MKILSIYKLPNSPAVYAIFGGHARSRHIAYVGIADKLKRRIIQHLVNRDSSVTTGTSTAGLNPDYVTEVTWWEHECFKDRNALMAAERVAFEILNPALRSRVGIPSKAQEMFNDEVFKVEMQALFKSEPKGVLIIPSLQSIIDRIEELENRIIKIEKQLQ